MTDVSPAYRRIEARIRGYTVEPPRATPNAVTIEAKIGRIWQRLVRDGHNPWNAVHVVPGRPLSTLSTREKVSMIARLRTYMLRLGYTVEDVQQTD